jgi:hypothetical protein
MAAVAEHSPFIRKLLGSLTDTVEPSPAPSLVAHLAHEWLYAGIEMLSSDVSAAVETLRTAVSLGSDEAMAWFGAALVHYSLALHPTEGRDVALAGLGWLNLAAVTGDPFAAEKLVTACEVLPASLVEKWRALPFYHFTTVH